MKKINIAIDGYSSSGKSTMARELASKIGYIYVDSGAMYRAVTLYALEHDMTEFGKVDREALVKALPGIRISFQPAGADGIQHTLLNGKDVEREIRDFQVSSHVSLVAEIPEVRARLVELQQEFGKEKGVVMDGRDIGTTVFPDAEMKVFVDASAEVRAKRRLKEMREKGMDVDYDEVLKNIQERDHIDSTRTVSPLRKAEDAHVLNNDKMTHSEQLAWLLKLFHVIENE
ncbi:MAG: (d)CMP kinase [Candidatus Amulumruptor caecigallinarius]|nr:(d)CMP kinase [Candidatus Amulumruptor caecigallinarius]